MGSNTFMSCRCVISWLCAVSCHCIIFCRYVISCSYFFFFILQHLMERSWYAVTETCLAFTVFRDDFSPKFVALFTVLLFLKSFHWLAEDRVDLVSTIYSLCCLCIVYQLTLIWKKTVQ